MRLVPWSEVTTSSVSSQFGSARSWSSSSVISVSTAPTCMLCSWNSIRFSNVVARVGGVADQLRGERRGEPARRQHPRPVRHGDVDEVQRRFGGDRGDVLAEHCGLAERAALVGAEAEPARVGVADVVVATAAVLLGAVGAPRVVDRRQAVAQRAGEQAVAVHDRGVLERLRQRLRRGASAQMSGGHSDVTDS